MEYEKNEYTVHEISKLLDVSEETVRRWIRAGRLRADRLPNKLGYTILNEYIICFLKDNPTVINSRNIEKIRGGSSFSSVLPVTAGIGVASIGGSIPFVGAGILSGFVAAASIIREVMKDNDVDIEVLEEKEEQFKREIGRLREKIELREEETNNLKKDLEEMEEKLEIVSKAKNLEIVPQADNSKK